MSVECPTCTETFDTERAVNIHHSMAHGESINYTECEECGEEFKPNSSDARFCSSECQGKNFSGKGSPVWKERISLNCSRCGSDFKVPPHDRDRDYCSHECYVEELEERTGKENPEWNHVQRECKQCGDMFSYVSYKDAKFCSMDCYSEHISGENHPCWKGGYVNWYGTDWNDIAEQVRERDNYECQSCGKTKQENGRTLSVHHLTPIREFDDYSDANTMDNLITLCRSCHQKVEVGKMECPEI